MRKACPLAQDTQKDSYSWHVFSLTLHVGRQRHIPESRGSGKEPQLCDLQSDWGVTSPNPC